MNMGSGEFQGQPVARLVPNPKLKFLDQCHEVMRFKQLAHRTEETYLQWIRRFILFHRRPAAGGKGSTESRPNRQWILRHPKEMGEAEVREFLTDLAVTRQVSAATQNQALNALLFLYREVLGSEMAWVDGFEQAQRSRRVPVVLSRQEMQVLLNQLTGIQRLIGQVLYGTGMRLMEGLRLRVKDVDFARGQVIVRGGKGDKDRTTMLPDSLRRAMVEHLATVRKTWQEDVTAGYGRVWLPEALRRKYPSAERQWGWQWVFPAWNLSVDPRSVNSGSTESRPTLRRHHVSDAAVQNAIGQTARRARLDKPLLWSTVISSTRGAMLRAPITQIKTLPPKAAREGARPP
jgi:integron integrase